jgi:hypothetical protein
VPAGGKTLSDNGENLPHESIYTFSGLSGNQIR